MSETVNKWRIAFRMSAFLFLFYVIGRMTWNVAGPMVENALIDPINFLHFDARECEGEDAIVSGFLDKTRYPPLISGGETEAEFLGLDLYTTQEPARRLPWRRVDEDDLSKESRRYGAQSIAIFVTGGCHVAFTATTQHRSPITGFIRTMQFGPFYPPINEGPP